MPSEEKPMSGTECYGALTETFKVGNLYLPLPSKKSTDENRITEIYGNDPWAGGIEGIGKDDTLSYDMLNEMADEIERLRSENAELKARIEEIEDTVYENTLKRI